jgi:hypothetical protein
VQRVNEAAPFSEAQLGYYLFLACLVLLGVGLRTRFRWQTTFVWLVVIAAVVAVFLDQSGSASGWYAQGQLACRPPVYPRAVERIEHTRRLGRDRMTSQDLAEFVAGCRSDAHG